MASTESFTVTINSGQVVTMNRKFFNKVAEVRNLQTKYFKGGKTKFDLDQAKKAEQQLDYMIHLINEQL